MLSNVKTQIEGIGGWLGSSIPKLRKGDAETEAHVEGLVGDESGTPASAESVKGSPQTQKDDDDNSRFVDLR